MTKDEINDKILFHLNNPDDPLSRKAQDAVNEYTRRRLAEPALGRRAMNAMKLRKWPIHGIFVILHDPEYMVTFEHVSVRGVQSMPTWGMDCN